MLGIELVMPTEFRGTGTWTASLLASIYEFWLLHIATKRASL